MPAITPLVVPEPNSIVDIAYSVAVVGILDGDDGGPCPTILLDGREFVVYPVEGSHRALPALDGQEVALRGGPPADPDEGSLECDGPVWVATSAMAVADVDFERPRIHPEPRWDPHYTPLTMSHEGVTVTYDRWFWAILDDGGFTTVAVADEVILHGPSEWIYAQDPSARITRFFDPWKGRFVAALPDEVFDAAYTRAAHLERGLLPMRADTYDEPMIIRAEAPGDFPGVASVNNAAFGGENEAYLIDLIRQSDLYVPELSLVAVEDDSVVGHVMFSYVILEGEQGDLRILDLAPLAVHPDHQNRGVGTRLTEAGLDRIEHRGEPLVLVEGIPSYYPRFGFERASLRGITPPSPSIPDDAFMVKLFPSYEPHLRGRVRYPEAFYLADAVGP